MKVTEGCVRGDIEGEAKTGINVRHILIFYTNTLYE